MLRFHPISPRFSPRHAIFPVPVMSWHDQGQKIPYRPFAARRIPQGGRTGCLPKQVVRQPRRSSAWSTDARTQGKIWAQLFFFHLPEELPVSRSAALMHGCGDAGSVPRYLRPLPVVARCCPNVALVAPTVPHPRRRYRATHPDKPSTPRDNASAAMLCRPISGTQGVGHRVGHVRKFECCRRATLRRGSASM